MLEDRRQQREPGRGPLARALVALAQDDGDRLQQEALTLGACGAHPAPVDERRRRRLERVAVLDREIREAGDQAAEAELPHGRGELALEQGDDIVDGRELIDVRKRGDRQHAHREDRSQERRDRLVDGVVGRGALRLRDDMIADGAERAVDEHVDALGGGVRPICRGLPGPAALQRARGEIVLDRGVAVLHELREALLLGQGADLPEGEEPAAGGEDIQVEDRFERSIHGILPSGEARNVHE
ncbi:hypothetical protein BE20_15155 [Sorangium cellulosum]|uniref:Uncharacterized protein n=1 Tax=Sorangium cellulosum TaxID=56 RepID=A0A150SFN2_SORCE|nr:hypothetical protein BE18_52700 [Sorangium cellulosum]KYF91303.1 hypothetical protein BE20_15155 [Sorangium cellulosum]